MKASELSQYFAQIGRKGGKSRLKKMTADERRAIAKKASLAAAAARKKKAREKAKLAK